LGFDRRNYEKNKTSLIKNNLNHWNNLTLERSRT
jgi:hypothetical protein